MRLGVLILLLLSCMLCGCVERRLYIYSDPPGADVYIDGEFVGQTRPEDHKEGPFYVNFIYYGKRDYTLRKPGFATQSGSVQLETPWFEYPPLDFFAEVLTPWIIVDSHEIRETLRKAEPADIEQLILAAEAYRDNARTTVIVPNPGEDDTTE
jgi:hypothetical protein